MILGIGADLASIEHRGQRWRFGDRFRNRVFTRVEQHKAEQRLEM
jgi:holo-[acyl-carrier protein] synthase